MDVMLDDCIPNKMPLDTHVAKISFSGAGKNYALIAAYVPILWKYNEVLSAGLQGARINQAAQPRPGCRFKNLSQILADHLSWNVVNVLTSVLRYGDTDCIDECANEQSLFTCLLVGEIKE